MPWLFEQYSFSENDKILELGCGNGAQWENRVENLPAGCDLILSDFSAGMVEIVTDKYQEHPNVSFEQIDIQRIPFDDNSFDVVIANHMLYHVPDLSKALSEVYRVLKKGGVFYCSTNGRDGMRAFLRNAMKNADPNFTSFTQDPSFLLQNGIDILTKYFTDVSQYNYEDSLSITKTQDLLDWMKSTISIATYSDKNIDALFDYFETIRIKDGAIIIPKECGLFISRK